MSARIARGPVAAWLLLVAYLPLVTFFGHWPLHVDVPGTDIYVGLPAHAAARAETGEAPGHDHARHCHADASGCTDVPYAGVAPVAMLARDAVVPACNGPLLAVVGACWAPRATTAAAPEAPPPRFPWSL